MLRRLLLALTDSNLRSKFLKIIGILIIARLLANIPIPLFKIEDISGILENDDVFSLLNTISGGAYGRLSFVMLGVGPYITASIVMQLLGVIIPRIREIQREEGEQGQQKINRWTRMLTIPLAALNAWGILQFLSNGSASTGVQIELPQQLQGDLTSSVFWAWFAVIASMTAGSVIMMWLGEIITEFKMGNGISMMILTGIVVRLPTQVADLWNFSWPTIKEMFGQFSFSKLFDWEIWQGLLWDNPYWEPVRIFVIFLAVFLVTLALVIFVNDAVRRLVVIYSRRGHTEGRSRTMSSVKADLPVKVNMAGVLPIIFAVSFILFPTILSRFFFTANVPQIKDFAEDVETYLSTENVQISPENPGPQGPLPNEFLGFYGTTAARDQINAINWDSTEGQDLFGFTISTYKVDGDFETDKSAFELSSEEREKLARQEVKNSFFEGTPLHFEFDSFNPGFLPEYSIHFDGVLAYTFFYFILIIFFTYFYTSTVAFKTDDVAENLQRSGAYIPGFRPGQQTMQYLSYLSNRLNVIGSLFLALIAVVPLVFNDYITFGDGTLTGIVGGTTLLILVSVTIETLKQIEAQATAVDYERFTQY